MKREVVVCDFCLRENTECLSDAKCVVCGADYCKAHSYSIHVQIEGRKTTLGNIGLWKSFEVCPDCNSVLTYDPWGGSDFKSGAEEDRKNMKLIVDALIPVAIETLKTLVKEQVLLPERN